VTGLGWSKSSASARQTASWADFDIRRKKEGGIGSPWLGLCNEEGRLDHVGFSSGVNLEERKKQEKVAEPLISPPGFSGYAPGGPSRSSGRRSIGWSR
jgi:hypothetical protein